MPTTSWRFSHCLIGRPDALNASRQALETWASERGVSVQTMCYVNLMLDEIVSNVLRHAYAGRDDGRVEILAEFDGDMMCVSVRDSGPPFDPLSLPVPEMNQTLNDRQPGGLGVHLVRRLADRIGYRRNGNINEIVFCRREARD